MPLCVEAGTSCLDGIAKAMPTPGGCPPAIDGRLDDWDRSGAVLCWNAEEFAETQNATLYFMYDATNLYFAVEMSLHDHELANENRPQDRYWRGDLVQLRLSTDRSLPYPLPPRRIAGKANPVYVGNDKVTCVNVWRNTRDGSDNLYITPGASFDCPPSNVPPGSAVAIVPGERSVVMETRVPWSALGVADGRCPCAPGERMPAVVDIKWNPGMDGHFTASVYRRDPGAFAYMNLDTWGQIEVIRKKEEVISKREEGEINLRDRYAAIAESARRSRAVDTTGWAEIRFDLPKKAKVSVNIFDERGGVIRELIGGELHEAGPLSVFWDGRDALGFPCETGREYRWGAYAHDGLDVVYAGTVGTSGNPPYDTRDGRGGWGGDHGPPVACAADATGRYFVWHMNESGRGIVKTDFDGNVVWRTMPFVVDGWGNYTCAAASGGRLYLVYERRKAGSPPLFALVVIDAATGNYEVLPDGSGYAVIEASTESPEIRHGSAVRDEYVFNCAGIAVAGGEVFVSDFMGDRIIVLDAKTGAKRREIPCKRPRGMCLRDGAPIAVSGGRVVAVGGDEIVPRNALENPYAVAVGPDGEIFVSDLGDSQQIKVFSCNGQFLRAYGRKGGRALLGRLEDDAFLFPFGLAADSSGAVLVAEASAPKVVSLLDAATGAVKRRYYGYTAYSPSNVPDPDDPAVQYYSLSFGVFGGGAFARANAFDGGVPTAVWDFIGAGVPFFGSIMGTMNMPDVMRCTNGRKYLAADATPDHRLERRPMAVCLIDGDMVKPVAAVFLDPPNKKHGPVKSLHIWMDSDDDGIPDEGESTPVERIGGRQFSWTWTDGAMRMESNGDLFLTTHENAVVRFPCRGFSESGVPRWDVAAAHVAIPEILPGQTRLSHTWRSGLLGLRRDALGNFYAAVDANVEYASPALTRHMKSGMGHTSEYNGVFLTKYAPDGRLAWRVGRKAVGGLKPGEMLHHWVFAGLVGDGYAVAASEWGVFTVYTADGFFVDSLFDAPGLPGRGIPYSFGGEDFSGRVAYFPKHGEVWAYNAGHTFRVKGFEGGRPSGEWRASGTVPLRRVAPITIPGAGVSPLQDPALRREGGKIAFSATVVDDSPLVNVAQAANAVFKGGDCVGFEIGPEAKLEGRPGFTRILAARIGGADRVVAFKTRTRGVKRPQSYSTPAGGTSSFEFVGDVPEAMVEFVLDAEGGGYRARVEISEDFFELDFSKPAYWNAQVLLSGEGGRGLGTVRKVYANDPGTSAATMVDDVPTESRLQPGGWTKIDFNRKGESR